MNRNSRLIRRTPLRATHPPRRRPQPREEDVDWASLYAYIMARDGGCVAAQLDSSHRCIGRQTLDHVPDPGVKGVGMKREIAAPSDRWHLVRVCWSANVDGWCSAHRDDERDYIARKEGSK